MEDKLENMDISKYKKYWTEQFKISERARILRYHRAVKIAHKIAWFIYGKYNVDRVYLFGSILRQDRFRLDSDIDIAALGLPGELLLKVHGEISSIGLPFKIDFVRIEDCKDYLASRIIKGGKLIEKQE